MDVSERREQVNAKGRLSIAMEVRNDLNAVDGLSVQPNQATG